MLRVAPSLSLVLSLLVSAGSSTGERSGPAVTKWQKEADGASFVLSDGRSVRLVVRSACSVRLSWTPLRAGKSEDWLIVPTAAGDRTFSAEEVGDEVVLKTNALRLATSRSRFLLKAYAADGKPIADVPLANGQPLKVEYGADHAQFYEDEHDYVWAFAPTGTRLELLRRYAEATGAAPMPPKWVMGIAYGSYADEANLPRLAATWRQLKLPIDAVWGDGGVFANRSVNDFTTSWNDQTLKQIRDQHFALGRWMMHSTRPGTTTWDEFSRHKWVATTADGAYLLDGFWGEPVGGSCPDPFDPAARAAYKKAHATNQGLNAGFNFFKVDFRDVKFREFYCLNHTVAVPKGFHVPFNDQGGTNPAWRLLLSRATFEATRDLNTLGRRGWVVTKYPVPGYQRYYCVWPDDHYGSFDDLRASADTMLQYARAGLPWYCDDLTGFKTKQMPSRELYLRWFQYGVFTPWPTLFGKAQAGQRVPWLYDEEAVRIFRKYDELRYRLVPYLYTYARAAHDTGRPIAVPLDMAYPGDPALAPVGGGPASVNYLYGGELLVAPVVREGAKTWDVYLPRGDDWIEYDTGRRHAGGTTATVDTPLDSFPLFVKAGSVIPMAVAGKQYVADGGMVDRTITWDVYPPAPPAGNKASRPASFTLYEDDGLSAGYETGQSSRTTLTVLAPSETRLTLQQGPTEGEFEGKPAGRTYYYKVNAVAAAPAKVGGAVVALRQAKSLADLEVGGPGSFYDAAAHVLWVRVDTPTRDPVALTIDF